VEVERTIEGGRRLEHWVLLAGAFAGLGLLLLLGLCVTPDPRGFGTHTHLGLPDCKTIEWWGVPCPGCGVTTSVCLAAHGRLLEALYCQPLGLCCALALAATPLWALGLHLAGRDLYAEAGRLVLRPWLVAAGLLVLVSWAWKLGLVRQWWG
jgi:Protein of unknown function (DUF2752)